MLWAFIGPILLGLSRWQLESTLAALIESKDNVCPRLQSFPQHTIHLIDGMALVQVLKLAGSSTFGELASKYFNAITTSLTNCKEVHIVFDQYWNASVQFTMYCLCFLISMKDSLAYSQCTTRNSLQSKSLTSDHTCFSMNKTYHNIILQQ